MGRRILVRLVDDHVALHVRFVDNGSDSSVCLVNHHAEVFVLLFGDIYGIGIEVCEHSVHTGALNTVERQGIHI